MLHVSMGRTSVTHSWYQQAKIGRPSPVAKKAVTPTASFRAFLGPVGNGTVCVSNDHTSSTHKPEQMNQSARRRVSVRHIMIRAARTVSTVFSMCTERRDIRIASGWTVRSDEREAARSDMMDNAVG